MRAASPPAESPPAPPETTAVPQAVSGSIPAVVLLGSLYANVPTSLTERLREAKLGDVHVLCSDKVVYCPAGDFCAWGTAHTALEGHVGIEIDGRLVATPSDFQDPFCTAGADVVWLVTIPTRDVPAGAVIKAVQADSSTQILRAGSSPRTSEFTAAATLVLRPRSALGEWGTGIAIGSTMRTVRTPNIVNAPQANDVDEWSFGVRYEAAVFSQDWLHRLAVVVGFDPLPTSKVRPAISGSLGGALSVQTSGGSALNAGLLAGLSAHVDWQVSWLIACSVGVEAQMLVNNGGTSWLGEAYVGPRVGF